MPWFMVDDKLHSHKKRLRAGIEAMGLWCVAGSWSADQLADGFVPDYVARGLDPKAERHAASLVSAGFWEVAEKDGERGWQFHEWAQRQPLRVEVEAKRAAATEKKRRQRRNTDGQFEGVPDLSPRESPRDNSRRPPGSPQGSPTVPSPTQPSPTSKSLVETKHQSSSYVPLKAVNG
jgi:hypothetical protein